MNQSIGIMAEPVLTDIQSELQLIYFFYNRNKDVLGNIDNDYNVAIDPTSAQETNRFSIIANHGGNNLYAMFQIANWVGPVAETTAPYTKTTDDVSLDISLSTMPLYHPKTIKVCSMKMSNMA